MKDKIMKDIDLWLGIIIFIEYVFLINIWALVLGRYRW